MIIKDYLTKDNITFLISCVAFGLSIYSIIISRKELLINRLKLRTEFYLGLSKLKELIQLTEKIENVIPTNITKSSFENDKLIINQLLETYYINEEKIIKTSYVIPAQIFEIKKTIEKLELNFDGISEHRIYSPEIEIMINYSHLFFMFSLLCSPFSLSDKSTVNTEEKRLYLRYNKMHLDFFSHKTKLMNIRLKNALEEIKNS